MDVQYNFTYHIIDDMSFLSLVQVLKLHAWEKCFGDKLDAARNKEVDVLRRLFTVKAYSVFCWNASPYVVGWKVINMFWTTLGHSSLIQQGRSHAHTHIIY